MTILVFAVLWIVTAGIIFLINYMNWHNITQMSETALETLVSNSGKRPSMGEEGPGGEGHAPEDPLNGLRGEDPPGASDRPKIQESSDTEHASETGMISEGHVPSDLPRRKTSPGQPVDVKDALASLSNYYVVHLSAEDEIREWSSDRSDLYTDEQVAEFTQMVLENGKEKGRIGSQFYRIANISGSKLLVVLDERLDVGGAGRVLRMTALIASAACILLCIAAWFLIRMMVRPVQEAFDRQRRFVGDASHELKTPLAVIGANADVLEGEIGENEYLGYIQSEVKRTDTLVRNLLTLARMDHEKTAVSRETVDLGKIIFSVALPFESAVFEEGKELVLNVPEGITCRGDEEMLKQLMVILLSNALKYSDQNGRITIDLTRNGRYKEIRVSNTGDGIAPETLSRVFERFYREDASHNRGTEGNGLGLAIAGNIVRLHHGKIRAASEPSRETVFTVTLP